MLANPRSEECGLNPEDATGIVSSKNQTNDLSTSCFTPVLLWLYRVLNCRRRWRVARVLLHLAQRLEGGPMRSATSRQMMSQFHGVIVGAHSYGDCFDPAVIPPGIKIGRYVAVAKGVRFFNQHHPVERFSTHPYFYEACPGVAATNDLPPGRLEIGHDVWIGCNAIVTPGYRHIGNPAHSEVQLRTRPALPRQARSQLPPPDSRLSSNATERPSRSISRRSIPPSPAATARKSVP